MRLYGSTVSYEELSRVSVFLARACCGRALRCVRCGHTCAAQCESTARVHVHPLLVSVRVIEW